jgi:RNA polymerase sigma-70 factor (ECF subfamily)
MADLSRRQFNTTHWSIVIACTGQDDSAQARDALGKLFQTYWYPLYAYVRHRGYGEHDAEDLVQAFCLRLQEKHALAKADPQRGMFRHCTMPNRLGQISPSKKLERLTHHGGIYPRIARAK